jgi:hypothetical protein
MKPLAKPLVIVLACALLAVPCTAAAQPANPPPPSVTTPDKVESRIGTLEFTGSHAEPQSRSTRSMTTSTSRTPSRRS